MKIIFLLLSLSCAANSFGAESQTDCASELPWRAVASASNGSTTITHFIKPKDLERDVWPRDSSCLLISSAGRSWWIPSLLGNIFEIGEFVDENQVLILSQNVVVVKTYLLNLAKRDLQMLGDGKGTYLEEGENRGLVLLQGQKRYRGLRGGPFWLNVLVQLNGEVVEFLPNEQGECLPVSEILRADEPRAMLRQELNDCISISF